MSLPFERNSHSLIPTSPTTSIVTTDTTYIGFMNIMSSEIQQKVTIPTRRTVSSEVEIMIDIERHPRKRANCATKSQRTGLNVRCRKQARPDRNCQLLNKLSMSSVFLARRTAIPEPPPRETPCGICFIYSTCQCVCAFAIHLQQGRGSSF
jgi:hypothetical protein